MMNLIHTIADSVTKICPSGASIAQPNCGLPTAHANQHAIANILSIVFGIVGALALLMIVLGGLRYIVSDGSADKTARARDSIIYALVGLSIALIAEAIVNFVVVRL